MLWITTPIFTDNFFFLRSHW